MSDNYTGILEDSLAMLAAFELAGIFVGGGITLTGAQKVLSAIVTAGSQGRVNVGSSGIVTAGMSGTVRI